MIPVFLRAPEGGFKKALRAVGGRLNHAPEDGQVGTRLFSLNQLQPSESPKIDALLVGGFFAPFERQGKLFNAAQFSCDLVDTHGQDGASISAALHARGLERAEEMKRQFEAEAQEVGRRRSLKSRLMRAGGRDCRDLRPLPHLRATAEGGTSPQSDCTARVVSVGSAASSCSVWAIVRHCLLEKGRS